MKIAIGGIKFSEKLVHVLLPSVAGADSTLPALLAALSQARVNLPFLTVSGVAGEDAVFCVAAGDFPVTEGILGRFALFPGEGEGLRAACRVRHAVGTLTIFPHRRSFALLGRVVATLDGAGIAVHSFCTSISALAINIEYSLLTRAVEVLDGLVELPENHAPFHPEFTISQTAPR